MLVGIWMCGYIFVDYDVDVKLYDNIGVIFKETPVFTDQITTLVQDDSYRRLQNQLICNPNLGTVIRNSGGLRKVRWRLHNGGKRGGLRVIYYWYVREDQIFMLLAYKKGQQDDLTPEQLKFLKHRVEEDLE